MKPPLWKVSVTTLPEAEDALADLLGGLFGQPAVSYLNVDTGVVRVSVYLARKPSWTPARRAELAAALDRVRASGLNTGPGRFALAKLPQENWAESWKRHFKPMTFGPTLLLKPSWSRRQPRQGQAMVVIDPGLSFGTGRHPTTAFCLQQLVTRRRPGTTQSFLDIGTGSGILAIAAAKLGYAPVEAFDFDPEAVRIARANGRQNSVRICFRQQDVTQLPSRAPRQYSLVCANLTSNLLLAERARILARLQPTGVLVLAGILKTEFAIIRQDCESAGLRMVASRVEKDWRSGAFRWAAQRTLIK